MRIGVFGGSFDPPHRGHIEVARRALRRHSLDKVVFVPANQPPHKSERRLTECGQRISMLRLALASERNFEVDDVECRRGGLSFTIDTLHYFRNKYPSSELFFIVGSDSLEELPSWRRVKEVVRLARFIVVLRAGFDREVFKRLRVLLGEEVVTQMEADMVTEPPVDVSSTEVRRRLAEGESVSDLVDESVFEYIVKNGLYIKERSF